MTWDTEYRRDALSVQRQTCMLRFPIPQFLRHIALSNSCWLLVSSPSLRHFQVHFTSLLFHRPELASKSARFDTFTCYTYRILFSFCTLPCFKNALPRLGCLGISGSLQGPFARIPDLLRGLPGPRASC